MVLVSQRTAAGFHAAKTTIRQIMSPIQPSCEAGTYHAPSQHPKSVWHNRNCAFACRMHLIVTLLSAVATTVAVLVGLEEHRYKERYFLFPSSPAKSVHSKHWPQALICLHDMQLLYSYCWLLKMSDNLISMYSALQYMGYSFSQQYREQLEKMFTKAYVCKQNKLCLEND